MLRISNSVVIPEVEIEISAIHAQGSGGQHVNKVCSAVHLRFDIQASSLPEIYKRRLRRLKDQRITRQGVIVIKSQEHRSQHKNREQALRRLQALIQRAVVQRKKRIPTRPTLNSNRKRLESKNKRGNLKALRGKVVP